MFHLLARRVGLAVIVALAMAAMLAALLQPFNRYEKNWRADSLPWRHTPTATVKYLRSLHGGTSNGSHDYHLDVAIFDTLMRDASPMRP